METDKYEQFQFFEMLLASMSAHHTYKDILIQFFMIFHCKAILEHYRIANKIADEFDLPCEKYFEHDKVCILFDQLPEECVRDFSHPEKPTLLDHFIIEFYKPENNWVSKFLFIITYEERESKDFDPALDEVCQQEVLGNLEPEPPWTMSDIIANFEPLTPDSPESSFVDVKEERM